jgi:zinc protease
MKNSILFCSLLFMSFLALPSVAQTPDRSTYPKPGELRSLQIPGVQTFTLANGLPVYLIEKQDLPIVQMIFSFNGGSIHDPADKPGVAAMTADLMDEGAGARSALELADEISFLGIQLGAGAGRENLNVSLFSPVSKLRQALPLLGDILLNPTFDEKELDRKRTEGIVRIAQAHDEARIIASTAFNQLVYGAGHPYSTPAGGTEASLKAMRPEDLIQFHKTHVHPNNGYLVIAGAISRAQAEAELGMLLKDWKSGALQSKAIPDAPKPKGVQVYLIDKPGAAQSELRFGHPGVARNTPDYFPIEVMNTILGASFTSRLNTNIREVHGYAYGAGSAFAMLRGKGLFLASSSVQTDATDKAISEFFKEFNAIKDIKPEELDKARNYLALGYPSNFESIEAIAQEVSDVYSYKLPENSLNQYIGNVLKVSEADVERVAKTYVDPRNMVLVVVGDLSKIEAGIKAMKPGKINYLTKEQILGPVPVSSK